MDQRKGCDYVLTDRKNGKEIVRFYGFNYEDAMTKTKIALHVGKLKNEDVILTASREIGIKE